MAVCGKPGKKEWKPVPGKWRKVDKRQAQEGAVTG